MQLAAEHLQNVFWATFQAVQPVLLAAQPQRTSWTSPTESNIFFLLQKQASQIQLQMYQRPYTGKNCCTQCTTEDVHVLC